MAEQFDLVIRAGRIVTPEGVIAGDVAIRDEKIVALGSVDGTGAREIAADDKWVMPGGVDPHAHIEQMSGMGLMNADTFETATKSAAMGGTTSVISFAAQQKGARLADTVDDYANRARRGAMIDHAFHVIVSDTDVAEFDDDLRMIIAAGHRSLKVFTTYKIQLTDEEILRVMSAARAHGALVCVHAENDAIIARARAALIAAGETAPHDHARSHPRMAEIEAIERMCRFVEYLDQPVMIFHVSTAEGAAAVRRARERGTPIWAETCPHYLLMTEDVLDQPDGGKWICSPPQRQAADQDALWQALQNGDLQIVSSDHAPYRYDASGKLAAGPAPGFHEIANGMPGLETRLPLLFDAMVSQRGDPEAFAKVTATAPADLYGLPGKGRIAVGMDADVVIWDGTRRVTYGSDDLHDDVGYNPWVGHQITGWPQTVMLRGQIIAQGGEFYGEPGQGRWLPRTGLSAEIGRE